MSNYAKTVTILCCIIGVLLLTTEALWLDMYEEEPYRADVTLNMLETGNWSVPVMFGKQYLSKPPGLNWFIALASIPFGTVTDFSNRIPTLILYPLFVVTVYFLMVFFIKNFWHRLIVSLASVLYLVWFVEKGAMMEIDLLFSYFVVLSQALWFYYEFTDRPYLKWGLSHLAAAMAFLIKGPIVFLFLYPTILCYRWLDPDRKPFHWKGVGLGIALFCLPVMTWLISSLSTVSIQEWLDVAITQMKGPVSGGTAGRTVTSGKIIEHLLKFPLETYFSFLPWCLLFLPLLSKKLRTIWWDKMPDKRIAYYCLAALTPWLLFEFVPEADIRYVLPLYPWAAVLLGTLFTLSPDSLALFKNGFRRIQIFLGGLLCLIGLALPFIIKERLVWSGWAITLPMVTLLIVGLIILKTKPFQNSLVTLSVHCLLFILIIKAGYLFVYLPNDKPELFTRKQLAYEVADRLKEVRAPELCLDVNNRSWMFFYLHQRALAVKQCSADQISGENSWFVTDRDSSRERLELEHTIVIEHQPQIYLYRIKDKIKP